MEPLYLRINTWEDPKYLKRMKAQQPKVNNATLVDKRRKGNAGPDVAMERAAN